MLAAAFGTWLLGAILPRLAVPGIDTLLRWAPFAIAFTIFAVGGIANSINIIDAYNGLAAGHAVIVLAAMAWVLYRSQRPFPWKMTLMPLPMMTRSSQSKPIADNLRYLSMYSYS
jgi:UDP-N-acetylmuramyl pentapeptide phosphotransferase/UDP-N-acetylglucosamine-1-phosphate transferase